MYNFGLLILDSKFTKLDRKSTVACGTIWYVLATHTWTKMFRIALIQAAKKRADKNRKSDIAKHT